MKQKDEIKNELIKKLDIEKQNLNDEIIKFIKEIRSKKRKLNNYDIYIKEKRRERRATLASRNRDYYKEYKDRDRDIDRDKRESYKNIYNSRYDREYSKERREGDYYKERDKKERREYEKYYDRDRLRERDIYRSPKIKREELYNEYDKRRF